MEGRELDCISCLTTLENMVFRNVVLADDSKLSLSALPRLLSLKLMKTRIPAGGALLRGAASLRELELDLNCIGLDDVVLAAASGCTAATAQSKCLLQTWTQQLGKL